MSLGALMWAAGGAFALLRLPRNLGTTSPSQQ
jgi:hypothetical protein